MIGLYREAYYNPSAGPEAELIVLKNRFGPVGTVKTIFDGPRMEFLDIRGGSNSAPSPSQAYKKDWSPKLPTLTPTPLPDPKTERDPCPFAVGDLLLCSYPGFDSSERKEIKKLKEGPIDLEVVVTGIQWQDPIPKYHVLGFWCLDVVDSTGKQWNGFKCNLFQPMEVPA